MLYEHDVIEAVCRYLASQGYTITQKCTEIERGDDLVAISSCKSFSVYVEAKGETSSKKTSNRYNQPFSGSQVKDHVANALYKAIEMQDRETPISKKIGVAFPKNDAHLWAVRKIEKSLRVLRIEVFWVTFDKKVEIMGNWQ